MYDEFEREIILPPKIEDKENVEKINKNNIVLFNSKDRNHLYDTNFNFSITFSPTSEFSNLTTTYINNNFKNIIEVKFIKLIIPNIYTDQLLVNALFQEQIINEGNIISTLSPFIIERSNYAATYKANVARGAATTNIKPVKFERISDLSYLLLNISEIQNTNYGTNKEINKSTFILVLDDVHDKITNSGSLSLNSSNVLVSSGNYAQESSVGNKKKMLHFKTLGDIPIIYYPSPLQYIKNLNITITTPEGKLLSNLNEFLELSSVRASKLYTNTTVSSGTDTTELRSTLESGLYSAIMIGSDATSTTQATFATYVIANAVSGTTYNSAAIIAAYNSYNGGSSGTTSSTINEPFRSHLIDLVITDASTIASSVNANNNFIVITTKKWFSSDEYSVGTKLLFKNLSFNTTSDSGDSATQSTPDFYIVNSESVPYYNPDNNTIITEGNEWWTSVGAGSGSVYGSVFVWHFYTPSTDTWSYDFANREFVNYYYSTYGNEYVTQGANSSAYGSSYITLTYNTNIISSSSFKGSYQNLIGSTNFPSNPNALYGSSGGSDGSYGSSGTTTTTQTTSANENIGGQRQFEKELFIKFLERSEGHTIIGLEHSNNLPKSSDLDSFGDIASGSDFKSANVPDINPTNTRLFDCFFIPFDYKLDYNVSSNNTAKIDIVNNFALPQSSQEIGAGIALNLSMQNTLVLNIVTQNLDFSKLYSNS